MTSLPASPGFAAPGAAGPGDPGAVPGTAPYVANQWAVTFAQPASFGTTPPALQSSVVALTPATSVGAGTGTPSAGNWLVAVCGWNQAGLTPATIGGADDIHSFWRPGDVTTSRWAVSAAAGKTRCSAWYTPNLARVPGDVYIAPSGAMAGRACLVIEIAGVGPWDTVTGVATAYAGAATSLSLALGAPSAASFAVAAVCGDSTAAGQAFTPGGWAALATVSASNGSDHTCDAVLTSAFLPSTSGSVSVAGAASSATDLSGVIIEFQITAASPVPGGANPAWPGRMILEAAFGSGMETPADQMTWTALSDSAWTSFTQGYKRFWGWADQSGVPYALGQLQSSTGAVQLDNADGAVSPSNTASPFWSTGLNSNTSFETGISPWALTDPSAAASAVQSSAYAHSGAYSMLVTPTNTGHSVVLSEQVPAAAGAVYSGSAWFYSPGGWATGGQVQINWYDSGHGYLSTSNTTPTALPAGVWTQVTLTGVTAPAGTGYAQLVVNESGASTSANTYYVDGAALVAGPAAATAGQVTTGTPIRLRMALGTLKDGTVVNRWYTWARDALAWPERRNKALRGYVPAALTDVWSVVAGACPSPYRAEIRQDSPYAWWACDDQPLAGGVLPTSLRNSALGNTNTLSIITSPNGTLTSTLLDSNGSTAASTAKAVAVYTVGAQAGWLYGDPQSSQASYQTSNPVTSNPGSAAWQQTGCQGSGGTVGFFLSCNDASFPALSSGVTVEGWYNYQFLGSNTVDGVHNIAQQPSGPLTLWTLTTASLPVAALQLDSSGHLGLITYSGSTPTTNSIYTATDLRDTSWFHVAVAMTTTTWTVYLNGGVTAAVSGSAAGMTSAWSWFLANGDTGVHGGGNTATIAHVGNVSVAHLAVYPSQLPAWRVLAHYCAGLTGFGLLPAPQSVTINSFAANGAFFPDGATPTTGTYGNFSVGFAFSARAVAVAGSYTSGPSAYAAGSFGADAANGDNVTVTWTGLAERFNVYTATGAGSETQAEVTAANYADFTSGYGGSATSTGVDKISGGNGSSPPASASQLGDTVAQRIERILGAGMVTRPNRAIDATASLAVQAATDMGGQQTGASVQNLVDSDNGLLYVDNNGTLCYRSRPHLAADGPAWYIGMNTVAGMVPFDDSIEWSSDPQRIWDAITVTPFSPDGASLASLTPADAATADAAQAQFGVRPKTVTSYLQDQSKMQAQADWYLAQFGGLRRRASVIAVDAASHPAGWLMVAGMNPGDIVQVYDAPFSQPATTGTYRVSQIARSVSYGANGSKIEGRLVLALDPLPSTYWS